MIALLNPKALALAALALPIVLLHMLRLRREERPISSAFLWQGLVFQREANAPWQRLRLSWLLLLQLLTLAALVLALARPYLTVHTLARGHVVLLLDASASMSASDVAPSRFARAQQMALEMIERLGADDTMTVIRVADVPEVLAASTRDRLTLRQAVQRAHVGPAAADWEAALTLAATGAADVERLDVVILSDGGLPPDLPPIPGRVRYVPIGERGDNVALSALAVTARAGRAPQLFAQIANYGDADAEVILDLRLDDGSAIYTARRYSVPAGGTVDIFGIALPADFRSVTARLTLPHDAPIPDYLAADNRAFAVPPRVGAGRVLLVTAGNPFLEHAFRSLRGVQLFRADPSGALPEDGFDLYVFDGVLPDVWPQGDLLLVNPPHGGEFFTLGEAYQPQGPLRAAPSDARVQGLDAFLGTVTVARARQIAAGDWAQTLIWAGERALLVAGELDGRRVAILPLDARYPNTDWVLQPAWPLLIAELAAWFSPPRITDAEATLTPGQAVSVRFLQNADRAVVALPNGERVTLRPQGNSAAIFAETRATGLYRVTLWRGEELLGEELFAVNLFAPTESAIAPREQITVGAQTITRAAAEETARRELWRWAAGAALALLVLEWWAAHRRRRPPRLRWGNVALEGGVFGGDLAPRTPLRGGAARRPPPSARTSDATSLRSRRPRARRKWRFPWRREACP